MSCCRGVIDIDEPFPALAGSFDYLGINYYTRDLVVGRPRRRAPYEPAAAPGHPRNDLGWEIYPEGLYRLLRALRAARLAAVRHRERHRRRARHAARRTSCARTSTPSIARAPRASTSIGYLHWSLIDNFEWSHGFRGRFGLFTIDFDDPMLTRRPTAAVAVFQEAARNLGTLR